MIGPGKYDDLCTQVRKLSGAEGVIMIVFNGRLGCGFSAQVPEHLMEPLPQMLRFVADQIEQDGPDVGIANLTFEI